MRLFIGIPVPATYVDIIRTVQNTWTSRLTSRLTWVRPELAHVTLKFLGNVADDTIPVITAAMRKAAGAGFSMQARTGSSFPSTGLPRVVWVSFDQGRKACTEYFERLERELVRAGCAAEDQPFVPHVTVARIKMARHDDWGGLLQDFGGPWPEFRVDRIVLWQSVPHADGPEYRVVHEVLLGRE